MAYVCQLVDGSGTLASIDLRYNLTAGISLLNQGIRINDPEIFETWGGRLENQLVRLEHGKRAIPMGFYIRGSDGQNLIDRLDDFQEMLTQAARYRKDGWGGEIFLEFKIDDATYPVRYPVLSGYIDKDALMKRCCEPDDRIDEVPIILNCEAYWEADSTYTLENYIDNPGFWRGAVPGDSWTEVDPAGNLALAWNTSIFEVMGRSLQWTISPDAVNDVGVQSDNQTVTASTQYYFEIRGYHTTGCDDITARVYDVSNAAVIAGSILTFNNQDNTWEKLGVAFTTPVGCVSIRVEVLRLAANSSAGDKTFYCDAVYLDQRSDAPTGWCSGRNLTNELDAADQINVLCVGDIPGETEAELRIDAQQGTHNIDYIHIAKRTRNTPHNMIWELLGVNAVVTAGDATCLDTVLAADANAPGGQRVVCNFAGTQTMALRTYWDITTNLASYRGKWQIGVLCDVSGTTDTITMQVYCFDLITNWGQGAVVTQTVPDKPAGDWALLSGWTTMSFPVGSHDVDQFGAGNRWRISVYAATDGGASPTDDLWIAGAYLIPVDEGYFIGGDPNFGNSMLVSVMELDGDRGVFVYDAATGRYYSNVGSVGQYPTLTPEIDNWLYFITGHAGADYNITDDQVVSVTYRPQGIFLRGTNP